METGNNNYKDWIMHAGIWIADPSRPIVSFTYEPWEIAHPSVHTAKRDKLREKKYKGKRLKALWIVWPLTILFLLAGITFFAILGYWGKEPRMAGYGGVFTGIYTVIFHLWLLDKFDL